MYNIENVVLFDKKQTKQFMCLFEARGISNRRNNYEKRNNNKYKKSIRGVSSRTIWDYIHTN